ncbi:quinone-dependent dihydroorotate dehydrogenase [Shewanella sp. 202IG2-18]|uniref:quinone-dependent dihydroorotate dehydrogenase n=1 Tax=Parashewanella hymeniacidonis TaxID=2807618 RepID=UPI001960CC63|nr:quinone-dependent dihydroorotate dehydrogenase [Parashewanella hymeniacidonis]MBM7071914.1 quinone-dependent dihydroorotate dehydrogenase [Parashewanella hymeniacidonis]
MFYNIAKKFMFNMDAEQAHDLAISSLKKTANTPFSCLYSHNFAKVPVNVMGIDFPNPVGLAAGLDKNGEAIDAFHSMGFGFVEVGTVTPRPQPGNEKPRLFRIEKAEAIINRMGFNNHGVDYLVKNLQAKKSDIIVGVNIGKNKDTPVENGKDDYLICMEKVYPYASYITVNISSPNTPDLRSLQFGDLLDDLLSSLKTKQKDLNEKYNKYVPLALKIAPDLNDDEVKQIANSLLKNNFDGVIATNTTLSREGVSHLPNGNEAGGLSGRPVTQASTVIIQKLSEALDGTLPIIGVGGISSGSDAKDKMNAGASLVQIYTGFIYKGPDLIKDILNDLIKK